jgi:hypothetical protein
MDGFGRAHRRAASQQRTVPAVGFDGARGGELENAPLGIDGRRDLADAAGDGLLAEPLRQDIDVPHTVQRWNNCRARTDRGGKIFDRGIERIGFDRKQHGIVGRRDGIGCDELWSQGDIAVRADNVSGRWLEAERHDGDARER